MKERPLVPIQELNRQREYMRLVREMDARPQKYHIVTLGCQMNERDSETIAGMLAEMGMESAPVREETCTPTGRSASSGSIPASASAFV